MPTVHRVIRTLIPDKMSQLGQEIYDLSGRGKTLFQMLFFHESFPQDDRRESANSRVILHYRHQVVNGVCATVPFPKDTRGVLYLHLPSGHSDISAQIRFRVCHTLAGFKQGRDLCDDITGEPWNVPLCSIVKVPMYSALYRSLLEEGLIDTGLISDIHNLPITRTSSYLYDLNQPFILDLAHNAIQLSLTTRRSLETIKVIYMLTDRRPAKGIHWNPYRGLVRARFEVSTLPEHVAMGPTLLVRILDIIKPVQCVIDDYDNYIAFPEAGAFVSKMSKKKDQYRPWHYSLNSRPMGKAFYTFIKNSQPTHSHNDMPRLASSASV
ncbi:hypothetical protein BDZ97DRAFT_1159615 [Flammula alnicola]|nr:hypothetical protein BDZ97DRAFT_1159615 [Flammula alnicola]